MPDVVCKLIYDGSATVKILPTSAVWQGITYKEDKDALVEGINELIETGEYPDKLWN